MSNGASWAAIGTTIRDIVLPIVTVVSLLLGGLKFWWEKHTASVRLKLAWQQPWEIAKKTGIDVVNVGRKEVSIAEAGTFSGMLWWKRRVPWKFEKPLELTIKPARSSFVEFYQQGNFINVFKANYPYRPVGIYVLTDCGRFRYRRTTVPAIWNAAPPAPR